MRRIRSDSPSTEAAATEESAAGLDDLPAGYDDPQSLWYVEPGCRPHYTTPDEDLEHVPSHVMRMWPVTDGRRTDGRPSIGHHPTSTRPAPEVLKVMDSFPFKLHELRLERARRAAENIAAVELTISRSTCACCGVPGGVLRTPFQELADRLQYILCRPCAWGLRRRWEDELAQQRCNEPYLRTFYEQVRPEL